MILKRTVFLSILAAMMALLLAGCETTPEEGEDGLVDGEMIVIPARDMEPVAEFVQRTKRLLIGEYVLVELSAQFYEGQLGIARDQEYVKRTTKTLDDGTIVISLKRVDTAQETNFDPDRLPRIYFGKGLEARAINEIRVKIKRRVVKDRPIFLKMKAVGPSQDSKLWVAGRLQTEKPNITIESSLLWSESFEHYKHKSAIY